MELSFNSLLALGLASAMILAGVSYLVSRRNRSIQLSDGYGPSLG